MKPYCAFIFGIRVAEYELSISVSDDTEGEECVAGIWITEHLKYEFYIHGKTVQLLYI